MGPVNIAVNRKGRVKSCFKVYDAFWGTFSKILVGFGTFIRSTIEGHFDAM